MLGLYFKNIHFISDASFKKRIKYLTRNFGKSVFVVLPRIFFLWIGVDFPLCQSKFAITVERITDERREYNVRLDEEG